jgi:hypothetical protein
MFKYVKSLNANQGRVLVPFTITDASVISVGEAVKLTSGKLVTWGAGAAGLGVVESIKNANGSAVTDNGASADFHGTYTAPTSNTVQAWVDVSKESVYSAPADAALGTTTGSNLAGYNIDCDSTSQTLAESSTVSTTASFFILGLDTSADAPDNSLFVTVQESQKEI